MPLEAPTDQDSQIGGAADDGLAYDAPLETSNTPPADAGDAVRSDDGGQPAAPVGGDDVSTAEATPSIPDELIYRAAQSGMSVEEARQIGSEQALRTTLDAMDRQRQQYDAMLQQRGGAPEAPTTQEEQQRQLERYELQLDEDAYDPEILETFRGLNDFYGERLDRVNQVVTHLVGNLVEQRTQEFANKFDAFMGSLGPEHEGTFGKGSVGEIDDTQFANREKVIAECDIYARTRHAQGLPPLPADELYRKGVQLAFGDQIATAASSRSDTAQRVRDASGRFAASPSNRDASNGESPEQRATRAVDAKLREYGLADD